MENIEFKEIEIGDVNRDLLDKFNRYQEVKRCYRNENKKWIIKNIEYIENWDKNKLENKIINFSNIITSNSGYIFGAYEDEKLIGFAVLMNKRFGKRNQYIQLENLHVSFGYRHKGIGKRLFGLCVGKTKEIGIEKLYISANTSEETQRFYLSIGCEDAMEINKRLAEEEPYDRQMEYKV